MWLLFFSHVAIFNRLQFSPRYNQVPHGILSNELVF